MAAWNTEDSAPAMLTREAAQTAIAEKAREEGITGSFKVYYNGSLISSPNDLPTSVNMSLVRVSAMFDNA